MKLWQKTNDVNKAVERFTVGRDREMDLYLAEADVLGSLAHTRMLESVGLLSSEDLALVQRELKHIYREIQAGKFTIEDGVEDVHSQVEFMLTQRIGDAEEDAFLHGDGVSAGFQKASEGCGSDSFAEPGDNAAGYKDVLYWHNLSSFKCSEQPITRTLYNQVRKNSSRNYYFLSVSL